MRLSVVIPASNAAGCLGHLLTALGPQLAPEDECIVVNDASWDATEAVARQFPVKLLRTTTQGGPAVARNMGARSAGGHTLVFLDADVVPHPDVLTRIRQHFGEDPNLSAVMGSYDDSPLRAGFVSQYRNLLHCYTHQNGCRDASTFWAGCGAVRRDRFEHHSGFDERYRYPSVEDIELGVRLRQAGERIVLDPAVQVQHRKIWGLRDMLRTDLIRRAVPWSELILKTGFIEDLNLRVSQRLSAVAAFGAVAAVPVAFWAPGPALAVIAVLLATVVALNWRFYRFLAQRGGVGFMLAAIPLHFLYFLCAGLGFLIALSRGSSSDPSPSLSTDP